MEESMTMLSPYRVLDLSDEKGFICGKLLGDLGADVIKIEKPGGDLSRRLGLFFRMTLIRRKAFYDSPIISIKGGSTPGGP
jgi:crotonobetainyl-CoA:carnitine CoA-transferase CaiB-like acyl-CoA transferase